MMLLICPLKLRNSRTLMLSWQQPRGYFHFLGGPSSFVKLNFGGSIHGAKGGARYIMRFKW